MIDRDHITRAITVNSYVRYRTQPRMRGRVVSIYGDNWRWQPRLIQVRWEPQFGIIPPPVFESESLLVLVSESQTRKEAA